MTENPSTTGIRLGLCCIFLEQPIKFRNTTVKSISGMNRDAALVKLSGLCLANAEALLASLQFCAENGIGCFRINSQILPVKTHVDCRYDEKVISGKHNRDTKYFRETIEAVGGKAIFN
ncbi:hypothetical protein [Rubinisphaera italica]|uniref:Putative UV damage endonuclease n=1 Tax=Rubinisphaera italica TaxID=2527969 RepID=A0A5C5XGE3_9PLAN|nr:hypothetical protein [Rubinisphaera italica]TWT60922.1 putative UV damage endonuclease [Rubinisphaera italica]